MNNVNQELGRASPYTQTVSLNDSNVRSLFQKTTAGSAISMSDGWGKSNATPASQAEWWNQSYNTTWTVPVGVTSVCIVTINGGNGGYAQGGGDGGNLSYKNNVSVTPGESLTIVVGAGGSGGLNSGGSGGVSSVSRSGTQLCGNTTYDYQGVGGGGVTYGGGGGAGGYAASGQAATGGSGGSESSDGGNGGNGAAGGGGGGWDDGCWNRSNSGNGGNTYGYGRGDNGAGGQGGDEFNHNEGYNGGDGSATNISGSGTRGSAKGGGGGGTGGYSSPDCGGTLFYNIGASGSPGLVRIIWGDANISRSFPSTNTKNV